MPFCIFAIIYDKIEPNPWNISKKKKLYSSPRFLAIQRCWIFWFLKYQSKLLWVAGPPQNPQLKLMFPNFFWVWHCYKHHQQRYNNENTKICMFIYYMCVDVLFPLMKAIPIVWTFYHTLPNSTKMDRPYNGIHYHNFSVLPHTLLYIFPQFSMVWCYLQHVTTCYCQIIKKNVY